MRKLLLGIFAHPDDEAFGPSGTLYLAARDGAEVHLICATRGEAGNNPDKLTDLGDTRLKEWQRAGSLIGARGMKNLGYPDGQLCNDLYLPIAEQILAYVGSLCGDNEEAAEIEMITMEPHGISGHLDHIAMAHIATYAYLRLRQAPPPHTTIGRLRYYCLSRDQQADTSLSWLYMPAGYAPEQIGETVDIKEIMPIKLDIMHAHHTQRDDLSQILSRGADALGKENFLLYTD